MTHTRRFRMFAPLAVALAAMALLWIGQFGMMYKVFDDVPAEDDPFLLFEKITDAQMVIESTFSGVGKTSKGAFYFTYDRTAALTGHKPCPT